MHTRWLSVRKRNPFLINVDHDQRTNHSSERQGDFDFAFDNESSVLPSPSPPLNTRPVELRPRTSEAPTGKRNPRVEVTTLRPRTSANQKSISQRTHRYSRSEDNLIGLAFGSPGHPPASFSRPRLYSDSLENNRVPQRREVGQEKFLQMQNRRWKKIGTVFKRRPSAVRREEVPSGPTIGLPTGFVVLDKSSNELNVIKFDTFEPTRPAGRQEQTENSTPKLEGSKNGGESDPASRPSTGTDASSIPERDTRARLPKLELDIPSPPLDRYSVMFRNLPAATRSSSLLARRSRTLDSLKSTENSRPTTKGGEEEPIPQELLTPLMPPRRLTTPTSRSPVVSKYSLFPQSSPAPGKIMGRVPFAESPNPKTLQLKRSATSPARLSPMQDTFGLMKPEPLAPKKGTYNESIMYSPEDNTASTDKSAPWSSVHSFNSSMSSNTTMDEIFFDIKSFRDSSGVEDGGFVMTRPDSTAVELARTRSKRGPAPVRPHRPDVSGLISSHAETESQSMPDGTPPTGNLTSATTTKHTSVNTAYFDEAIAAVERLTSPSTAELEKLPPITFNVPSVTVGWHHEDKSQTSHHKAGDHGYARLGSKSRGGISRLIPSPVVEVKEDQSPRPSDQSLSPQPPSQAQFAKVVSPRIAAARSMERPIDDSPTIPSWQPRPQGASLNPAVPLSPSDDSPPPVPEKDAKFIPLSKYAAKSTVAAIERTGIIPQTRVMRANTDNSAPTSATSNTPTSGRATKERSATIPAPSPQQPPRYASPSNTSLRGLEKAIPPRPNPVALNPVTTEVVAVARSVSLSRKQSARIHVPGPKLAARRAEAQPQPQGLTILHNRQASAAAASDSRTDILGLRHRRSLSRSKMQGSIKVVKRESPPTSATVAMQKREKEKALIQEAKKWEILEKKSYSPVVVQAGGGHRPGLSVGLVVENV